jgi:hypothetical protein
MHTYYTHANINEIVIDTHTCFDGISSMYAASLSATLPPLLLLLLLLLALLLLLPAVLLVLVGAGSLLPMPRARPILVANDCAE